MNRFGCRFVCTFASLMLVLSGAWNVRGALLEKRTAADSSALKTVVTQAGSANSDLHVARTNRRNVQLAERRKERTGSWQGNTALLVQLLLPCALPVLFGAMRRFSVVRAIAFNKYKSVTAFLQTVI